LKKKWVDLKNATTNPVWDDQRFHMVVYFLGIYTSEVRPEIDQHMRAVVADHIVQLGENPDTKRSELKQLLSKFKNVVKSVNL